QLSRGPRFVETEIELHAVEREVDTQRIGGGPAERLPDVLSRSRENLGRERNNDEGQRGKNQEPEIGAGQRRVDEEPQELRIDELQDDARGEQDGQHGGLPPLRSDIRPEQFEG